MPIRHFMEVDVGRESEEILKGIGCLIAFIALILSIASIPFLGPIPIAFVFGIGAALYKSKGRIF